MERVSNLGVSKSGVKEAPFRSRKGRFSKRKSAAIAAVGNAAAVALKRPMAKSDENDDPCPEIKVDGNSFHSSGRRAIYLPSFANALSECSNPACKKPLTLKDCTRERQFRLASVLTVLCRYCGFNNKIDTDTRVESAGQRDG